jgi:protein phosphatase
MPHPGYLMLCSDGLWGVVSEEQILTNVKNSTSPALACQALIAAANENGGPDNISVILVRYPI